MILAAASRRVCFLLTMAAAVVALSVPAAGAQEPPRDPPRQPKPLSRKEAKAVVRSWRDQHESTHLAMRPRAEIESSERVAREVQLRIATVDHRLDNGPALRGRRYSRSLANRHELTLSDLRMETDVLGDEGLEAVLAGVGGDPLLPGEEADPRLDPGQLAELAGRLRDLRTRLVWEQGTWILGELAVADHEAALDHLRWLRSVRGGARHQIGDLELIDRLIERGDVWLADTRARLETEFGAAAPLVDAVVAYELAAAETARIEKLLETSDVEADSTGLDQFLADLRHERRVTAERVHELREANLYPGTVDVLSATMARRVADAKVRAINAHLGGPGLDDDEREQAERDLEVARLELTAARARERAADAGGREEAPLPAGVDEEVARAAAESAAARVTDWKLWQRLPGGRRDQARQAQLELEAVTARRAWLQAAGLLSEPDPPDHEASAARVRAAEQRAERRRQELAGTRNEEAMRALRRLERAERMLREVRATDAYQRATGRRLPEVPPEQGISDTDALLAELHRRLRRLGPSGASDEPALFDALHRQLLAAEQARTAYDARRQRGAAGGEDDDEDDDEPDASATTTRPDPGGGRNGGGGGRTEPPAPRNDLRPDAGGQAPAPEPPDRAGHLLQAVEAVTVPAEFTPPAALPEPVPAEPPAAAPAVPPRSPGQPPRTEGGHPVPVVDWVEDGDGEAADPDAWPAVRLRDICLPAGGMVTFSPEPDCGRGAPGQPAPGGEVPCQRPGGVVTMDTDRTGGCDQPGQHGGRVGPDNDRCPPVAPGADLAAVMTWCGGAAGTGPTAGTTDPPCPDPGGLAAFTADPCPGPTVRPGPDAPDPPCAATAGVRAFDLTGAGCPDTRPGPGGPPCLLQGELAAFTVPGCDPTGSPDLSALFRSEPALAPPLSEDNPALREILSPP